MVDNTNTTLSEQLDELLSAYPNLKAERKNRTCHIVWGQFQFSATYNDETIEDTYRIQLFVPDTFPQHSPKLKEVGGRIPHSFHTFGDESKCLGSTTAIRRRLFKNPSLLMFVNEVVVPYLYSFSYQEKHGRLPYGELAHDEKGILQDYAGELARSDSQKNVAALELIYRLGLQHIPKHTLCPCGSKNRLSDCHGTLVEELRECRSIEEYRNEAMLCSLYLRKNSVVLPYYLNPESMVIKFWAKGKKSRKRKRAAARVTHIVDTYKRQEEVKL